MSQGSVSSGEDLVAGRANYAESITKFWAQVPPGNPIFDGPAIFMVEVAKDLGNSEWDKSDYEDNDNQPFTPSNQLNGIMAAAWSGSSFANPGGDPGGTGVIGRGGANQGTGVQGLGGGIPDPLQGGAGGIGVHGIGGSQTEFSELGFLGPNVPPGAGVVGQGGRQPQSSNELRLPHAAGVIGIGGGSGPGVDALPSHTLMETGGVGVYGQGADLTITMVFPPTFDGQPAPAVQVPSGPVEPGIGVVGRGGVAVAPSNGIACGVVGLAGGFSIPLDGVTDGLGVFGQGNVGVSGTGPLIGVFGNSDGVGVQGGTSTGMAVFGAATKGGRGGVFGTDKLAQLQLIPHSVEIKKPNSELSTPLELTGGGVPQALPKAGISGDILAIDSLTKVARDEPEISTCSLWLCIRSENKTTNTTALWSQILLGGSVNEGKFK